jgi:hypothetical protein
LYVSAGQRFRIQKKIVQGTTEIGAKKGVFEADISLTEENKCTFGAVLQSVLGKMLNNVSVGGSY